MNELFSTKDIQLAAALRFALGSESHVETIIEDDGTALFRFDRKSECLVIMRQFFASSVDADGFPQTLAIDDARGLLRQANAVFRSLATARAEWRRAQMEKSNE
jgi:hypothetical protein